MQEKSNPKNMQEQSVRLRALLERRFGGKQVNACVRTFGCQANVSDSEHIKGALEASGVRFTDRESSADIIVYNTCAIREHAENRVLGNIGALKSQKASKPAMILCIFGCMMQQEHRRKQVLETFPFVDIVFGTGMLHRFQELLIDFLEQGIKVSQRSDAPCIEEGFPVSRDSRFKAFVPIMNGCDNFCSYCIVPYVRGREISRHPEDIERECRQLAEDGYKEITLIGQNVNSYGNKSTGFGNFPDLLKRLDAIPGDFWLRFMTSHPKDCTRELLDTMAQCGKAARHLHLPVQSGSDRILALMNRGYTASRYLETVRYARRRMPDLSITSDIITGFPGETNEDFLATLRLVKEAEFNSIYTFIYSPRKGTKAFELPDDVDRRVKTERLAEIVAAQDAIGARRSAQAVGRTYRVLCEGTSRLGRGYYTGRAGDNTCIAFPAKPETIGSFLNVRVTKAGDWELEGVIVA
ncbi:MAG TPA: tRNA (N6-isopentenyl adenosine(37)-C2)-methylthiotransferase MiaB [Clostridiales bacterium]|nr:MAG: (Dimethylallyl)adenosine tRNA methylthiotransferase MiaB [Firmicutes bacterium ADurb.Bin262]HOU10363.1 tRNA (N6-isopentenyl adenosine(37)-C2)-methylthiotransferase MiaB [Clostridiales bacterium]HQK73096.1 tRNA (N6-isopentenyl adenosine(37)-C2)-methylthiotransferase MiaB [Clostridiales bacterium]